MNSKSFRPMLACKAGDLATLRYPLIAQPKLDGIRCLVLPYGKAVTRALKPIPNEETRKVLEYYKQFRGLDGELFLKGATRFDETNSAVMKRSGFPDINYVVFDDLFLAQGGVTYGERLERLRNRFHRPVHYGRVTVLCIEAWEVANSAAVETWEAQLLDEGHEGLILRDPNARYKYGRSTRLEQGMLKLKRFEDAEAEVLGVEPLYANDNTAQRNALGLTERSSRKAGKRKLAKLGCLVVRDLKTGVRFELGTGFTDAQRRALWKQRAKLPGQLAKYRSQPHGKKNAPRFPVFLGLRSRDDL